MKQLAALLLATLATLALANDFTPTEVGTVLIFETPFVEVACPEWVLSARDEPRYCFRHDGTPHDARVALDATVGGLSGLRWNGPWTSRDRYGLTAYRLVDAWWGQTFMVNVFPEPDGALAILVEVEVPDPDAVSSARR